jgi:hypothetical protein
VSLQFNMTRSGTTRRSVASEHCEVTRWLRPDGQCHILRRYLLSPGKKRAPLRAREPTSPEDYNMSQLMTSSQAINQPGEWLLACR